MFRRSFSSREVGSVIRGIVPRYIPRTLSLAVEQTAHNRPVVGSNPTGSIYLTILKDTESVSLFNEMKNSLDDVNSAFNIIKKSIEDIHRDFSLLKSNMNSL